MDLNNRGLSDAMGAALKPLQRADLVWSTMKLGEGEVLLVRLAKHMIPLGKEVQQLIDTAFGKDNNRVIIYYDGDADFTKVTM